MHHFKLWLSYLLASSLSHISANASPLVADPHVSGRTSRSSTFTSPTVDVDVFAAASHTGAGGGPCKIDCPPGMWCDTEGHYCRGSPITTRPVVPPPSATTTTTTTSITTTTTTTTTTSTVTDYDDDAAAATIV